MKALNLIIALLLCTQAYGQDFDLDDLKAIDSEKAFKRFCFENEFVHHHSEDLFTAYGYPYDSEGGAQIWAAWFLIPSKYHLSFVKHSETNSSMPVFDRIVDEVKMDCDFYDFHSIEVDGEVTEYACYECPGAKYDGKIGLHRGKTQDFIQIFGNYVFQE